MSDTKTIEEKLDTNPQEEGPQDLEPRDDSVIEVDPERVQDIISLRSSIKEMESYFSSLVLQHERAKRDLLNRISSAEESLYAEAYGLRRELNISESVTYELKLPETSEEKAYFIRKEE